MADAADTQPQTIQGLVLQNLHTDGNKPTTTGSSCLYLPGYSNWGSPGWNATTQAPRFWVLDAADPTRRPLSITGTDPATVPPGLEQVLDSQHILVAAVLGFNYSVPQGPLYHLLRANGAGTTLDTIEKMNTIMACGTMFWFSYVLASVAGGGGVLGIEFLELPVPVTTSSWTTNAVSDTKVPALFDLVLDSGTGLYYPEASLRAPGSGRLP